MSLSPGDLVEVVNTPPPGFFLAVSGRKWVGARGVVVTPEYDSHILPIRLHDVRFAQKTTDVATCLLKKISGPPSDGVDEPTATGRPHDCEVLTL